jgi:type II secretory pathway component PulF
MVEHGVPLPEGLRLATRTAGDARLESAGRNLAAALQAGQSLEACGEALNDLPPLARWLLISSQSPAALAGGLHQAAASYRHMAQRVADRAQLLLPLLCTGVFGAGATFVYVLLVYSPYVQMLWSLATKY